MAARTLFPQSVLWRADTMNLARRREGAKLGETGWMAERGFFPKSVLGRADAVNLTRRREGRKVGRNGGVMARQSSTLG